MNVREKISECDKKWDESVCTKRGGKEFASEVFLSSQEEILVKKEM